MASMPMLSLSWMVLLETMKFWTLPLYVVVSLSPVRHPVTVLQLTITLSGVPLVPKTPMPYALPALVSSPWIGCSSPYCRGR